MQAIQQLIRFGLAGAINTSVAYLVFALLLFLGAHYTVATLASGVTGLAVGYHTTGGFVFRYRGESRWLRFIGVFIAIYLLNIGIQRLLHPYMNFYLSGALAASVSVPMAFWFNRSFVFSAASEATSRPVQ